MTKETQEQIRRELWFTFFTEYLFKNNLITEEQKRELTKNI